MLGRKRRLGGRGRVRFEVVVDRSSGSFDLVVASTPELADATSAIERKILMPEVEAIELLLLRQEARRQSPGLA